MGRWEFLGTFAIAATALVVVRFGPPYAYLFGATAAAWVQAGGVFAAVLWSGKLARDLAAARDAAAKEQLVSSAQAVVFKALTAINNIEASLILKADGVVVRDPIHVLDVVAQALTPKRIHELPDPALVDLAVDIRSDIAELWHWVNDNKGLFDPGSLRLRSFALPPRAGELIKRGKTDCEQFITFAASRKWR